MNHDGLKMWIRRTLRQPARRLWQWTLPPGDRAMVLRDMGRGRPSPGLMTELEQDFATWANLQWSYTVAPADILPGTLDERIS